MKRYRFNRKALAQGYRSGLELAIVDELKEKGAAFEYESRVVRYTVPARGARYTPDFILPNGIIIEAKGEFDSADRKKHRLVKEQHPDLDIRFVFSEPRTRISKKSDTTYAMWCNKQGIPYAKRSVPDEWLNEPFDPKRMEAIEKAGIKHDLP